MELQMYIQKFLADTLWLSIWMMKRCCFEKTFSFILIIFPSMSWVGIWYWLDYIEEINLKNSICWYAFYASGWQLKHSYLLHPSFSCDDVINLNPFPRYWPFVWGINRSPVNFPPQKGTATQDFDVFFDLRLNKLLSKQSGRRWFEMPALSILRHCNKHIKYVLYHLFMMHHKEVEIKPIMNIEEFCLPFRYMPIMHWIVYIIN